MKTGSVILCIFAAIAIASVAEAANKKRKRKCKTLYCKAEPGDIVDTSPDKTFPIFKGRNPFPVGSIDVDFSSDEDGDIDITIDIVKSAVGSVKGCEIRAGAASLTPKIVPRNFNHFLAFTTPSGIAFDPAEQDFNADFELHRDTWITKFPASTCCNIPLWVIIYFDDQSLRVGFPCRSYKLSNGKRFYACPTFPECAS